MTPQENWTRCKPWIEAAHAEGIGLETIEDVERNIESGVYQVWFAPHSCAVTEVISFERRKLLRVNYCGGDLVDLLDNVEPALCAFAKHMGCDGIYAGGRKGWQRVVEGRGYRFGWVTMIKDIS